MAQREGRTRPARRSWFAPIFGLYAAGLLLWLALGLVPPLASAVPALNRVLIREASGTGLGATLSMRVLMHRSTWRTGLGVGVEYLFSLLNLALGLLLVRRGRGGRVPRLLGLAFLGTAATFNEPAHMVFHVIGDVPPVTVLHFTFHVVSGVAYLWAVLLFPDGHLPARLAGLRPAPRWAVAVGSSLLVAVICWRSSFVAHPPFFVAFFGIGVAVVGIVAQTARLRHDDAVRSNGGQGSVLARQQSRILRGALVPAFLVALTWLVAHAVDLAGPRSRVAGGVADAAQASFPAVFAVVPVALFVAVLRFRLFDIDVLVSRGLTLAVVAGFAFAAYVVVVLSARALFGGSGWTVVAAMTGVGLALEPVRHRAQALANRLIFGQRLTPRQALEELADQLSRPDSTAELVMLTTLAVQATRVSDAQLWLVFDDHLLSTGDTGQPTGARRIDLPPAAPGTPLPALAAAPGDLVLPVRHEGQLVAVLGLTVPAGLHLPARERELLDHLAGHAGLLVANARLAADLTHQIELVDAFGIELRDSRAQVVSAQQAERRRLERDIHDGAQQQLVAILLQLRLLQRHGAARPRPAQVIDLIGELDAAGETLRQLVSGSRPPALDAAGLAGALDEAAQPARRHDLRVAITVTAPATGRAPAAGGRTSWLPPDIETAVYFCCREALQNATKHARATLVTIAVDGSGADVRFSVTDDGVGFDPTVRAGGTGMRSLVERLALLGGTVEVRSAVGAGTAVTGRVPVPAADAALVGANR